MYSLMHVHKQNLPGSRLPFKTWNKWFLFTETVLCPQISFPSASSLGAFIPGDPYTLAAYFLPVYPGARCHSSLRTGRWPPFLIPPTKDLVNIFWVKVWILGINTPCPPHLGRGTSPHFWIFASLDPGDLILPVVNDDAHFVVFGPVSLKGSGEISSLILPDQE